MLRGTREHRLARGGGSLPQLHAAAHHAGAAGGRALVRRERGVALDQLDAIDTEIELLGDHLPHRDAVPGAQIDLAGVDGHAAVALEREKGVDRVELQRASVGRARAGVRAGVCATPSGSHVTPTTSALSRRKWRRVNAAIRMLSSSGSVAGAAVAARCTARSTRSCDPQRHRLPANAACACSRVGFGVLRNSATVAITMPLLQ